MLRTLDEKTILETIKNSPNGRLARVTYKTELPLKAEFKKQGYHIIKVTETTGRFGVNYHNIARVIARKAEQELEGYVPRSITNNYEWIIENKVKHNNKTGKDYIVMASFNGGHNTKSQYLLTYDNTLDTTKSFNKTELLNNYKDMVINSYWNSNNKDSEIKTIAFENVIRIGEVGEKVNF